MQTFGRLPRCRARLLGARALGALTLSLLAGIPAMPRAYALSDELQVYTGEIASPGTFDVTVHNYYIADEGDQAGDSGSGLAPDHSLTGGAEWAYGATPYLELGTYLPIYTLTGNGVWHFDGAEIRALLTVPGADQRHFVYGANVSLEMTTAAWDPHRTNLELQPIFGWRQGRWRLALNPNLEGIFGGPSALAWTPAARLDYTLSAGWMLGVEEYAENTGTVEHVRPLRAQDQRLFAIADIPWAGWMLEPGLGIGLTAAAERLTVKLLLSRPIN